ncbi:MAG: carboxylating nicotinate-nucleotide diphosphorylase [Gemmatimonadota bacterium]
MTEAGGLTDLASDAMRVAAVALAEDGADDITSRVTIGEGQQGRGLLEAREPMAVAGLAYADAVVAALGLPAVEWRVHEGERLERPQVIGTCAGSLRVLLRAERPLLNLLQRACGIATMTARCVDAVAGTGCRILHTRKTTPGLRTFEVGAVLAGGGALHRLDLVTAVMVKDNHWQGLAATGRSLAEALSAARAFGVEELEVEVESLDQLEEACRAGATRLLIDNQSPDTVAEWVGLARRLRPTIELEATGGITLETMAAYARSGVDFISTGMLTHSVRSADLGMEVN